MQDLLVIQGDSLDVTLTLEKPSNMIFSSIIFDCPSLHMQKELYELTNDEDLWGFHLDPIETVNLRVGHWDYYITATTETRDQYTVIYRGTFTVQFKKYKSTPVPPHVITGIGYTED